MRRSLSCCSFGSFWRAFILIGLVLLFSGCQQTGEETITPPRAEKIRKELTIHGHARIDNYYWLNDRDNPKVIEYLEAENAYKESVLKPLKTFQKKLYKEIVGRIKEDDASVPYYDNGYFYYDRYEKGQEYPLYCRKKEHLDAPEEILLDVNQMAEEYDYYHVRNYSVSPDNRIMVFGVDTISRRQYTLHFKNLETGEIYPDKILHTSGSAVWANDNKTVFYTLKEKGTLRYFKIMKHVLGTDSADDELIFHETDPTFDVYVYRSKSDKYLIISSSSTLTTEYRILEADKPEQDFRIFHPRERGLEYHIDHIKDRFYIRTNFEALNFRLMMSSITTTSKSYWEETIPHRPDVLLTGFEVFSDHLVLEERKDGLRRIRIRRWDGSDDHVIDFKDEAYFVYLSDNYEMETSLLRFEYESMATPESVYDYDMNSRSKTLLKQMEVKGGFDPDLYRVERHYAQARDGVLIPISLVYRKDLKDDIGNPLLLRGYGSYGSSNEPYFSSTRLSLIDRGFIVATAHIRGGQEMGRFWYENGKLLKKKNTFTDFIDCALHLIDRHFTSPDMLFAQGGSAGGLLMGAVVNMRPDLFRAVIAEVPFVDVVTTMLDESIPLTTSEFDEWGNPKNKEYYDYMLSYSPYDNVGAKDYPSLFVTTGLHDSQVQYWEPAKWVAKLRELKTDNNHLLLHTNMQGGHSGVSGRFRQHEETAMIFSFILDLAGIRK